MNQIGTGPLVSTKFLEAAHLMTRDWFNPRGVTFASRSLMRRATSARCVRSRPSINILHHCCPARMMVGVLFRLLHCSQSSTIPMFLDVFIPYMNNVLLLCCNDGISNRKRDRAQVFVDNNRCAPQRIEIHRTHCPLMRDYQLL